jgi:dTDP-4-amino-4,6-dideoxygalactose transaminase
MLVTDRDDLCRRVLFLRDHGRAPATRCFGTPKSRINTAWQHAGALGLAQLERVEELVQKSGKFAWYREWLASRTT